MQSSLKRFFAGVLIVAMIVTMQGFNTLAATLDTIVSVETKFNQEKNKSDIFVKQKNNGTYFLMKGDEEDSQDSTTMSSDTANENLSDNVGSDNDNDDATKIQIDIDIDDEEENENGFIGPVRPLEKIEEEAEEDLADGKKTVFGGGYSPGYNDPLYYIPNEYVTQTKEGRFGDGRQENAQWTIKLDISWIKAMLKRDFAHTSHEYNDQKICIDPVAEEADEAEGEEICYPFCNQKYSHHFHMHSKRSQYVIQQYYRSSDPVSTIYDPVDYASISYRVDFQDDGSWLIHFAQNTNIHIINESSGQWWWKYGKFDVIYDFSNVLEYTGQYHVNWELEGGRWIWIINNGQWGDSTKACELYDSNKGITEDRMPVRGDLRKDNHVFAGWKLYKSESDYKNGKNGKLVTKIDKGTKGDIWLQATWVESRVNEGDYVYFGKHYKTSDTSVKKSIRWQVIDFNTDEKRALLLATNIIDAKPYIQEGQSLTSWKDSYLRNWLNDEFYNNAFSDEERKDIKKITRTNEDADGKYYNDNYNKQISSEDYVSLLSYTDRLKYGDYLRAYGTDYYKSKFNESWEYQDYNYWLRTLCHATIHDGIPTSFHGPCGVRGNDAYVWQTGVYSTALLGVRPIVWVDCNFDSFEYSEMTFRENNGNTGNTQQEQTPQNTEYNTCTVTWNLDGGNWKAGSENWATNRTFSTGKWLYSSKGEFPSENDLVAPEGYKFNGWTITDQNGNKFTYTDSVYLQKEEKTTVKANWKKDTAVVIEGDYVDIPLSYLRAGEKKSNKGLIVKPDKDSWKYQLGLSEYDNIVSLTNGSIDTNGKTKIATIKYKSAEFSGRKAGELLQQIYAKEYDLDPTDDEDFMFISGELLSEYRDFVGGDMPQTGDTFVDSKVEAEVWQDENNNQYVKFEEKQGVLPWQVFCVSLGAFLPTIRIKWDFSNIDVNHFVIDEGAVISDSIEWVLDGGQFKDEYKYYENEKHKRGSVFTLPGAETLEAPYRKIFKYWSIDGNEVTEISAETKGKVTVQANWSRLVDNFESFSIGKYQQNGIDVEETTDIEWIILDKVDDKLLLITKNVIDNLSYDSDGNAKYIDSSIKDWLNNEFYNTAFSDKQKANICDTSITDTEKCKVFLLNTENANYYFANDMSRIARATDYAKEVNNGGDNLAVRSANVCEYWLRSDANGDKVPYVSFAGDIKEEGIMTTAKTIGVRPAIWVKANKIEDIVESPLERITNAIFGQIKTYKEYINDFFGNLFN